jgi:peroxiredoxin
MKQLRTTALLAATFFIGGVVIAQPKGMGGTPPKPKDDKAVAEIGEVAPAFSLEDQWGETHTLKEYEGKIVVLEWFNETCPFCKRVWKSGLVPKVIDQLGKMDAEVVYLAVNSTANRPKDEVLVTGAKFLEDLEVGTPMLMDFEGEVGHAYGAKTTPHIFIIDVDGVLAYHGALSDDPRGKEGADAETHVVRVVKQLHEEQEVKPNYVKPWGCSVKYAKGGKNSGRPKRPRRGSGAMGMP